MRQRFSFWTDRPKENIVHRRSFYEFFADGGMAHAGLGAEWECLFANDFDPAKAAYYAENWGSEHLHVGDVRNVTATDLPGQADLAWASFRCQDMSVFHEPLFQLPRSTPCFQLPSPATLQARAARFSRLGPDQEPGG